MVQYFCRSVYINVYLFHNTDLETILEIKLVYTCICNINQPLILNKVLVRTFPASKTDV